MKKSFFIPFVILLFSAIIIFLPNTLWLCLMLVDFFTPWEMSKSDLVAQYHQYLLSKLPEIPEKSLREIHFSEASLEKIFELTDGYITPLVIRAGVANVTALGKWSDKNFWLDNYGEEMVMCGQVGEEKEPQMMKIKEALTDPDPWYIAGEVKLLSKYPDLMKDVYAPHWDGENHWVYGDYVYPNMFMGYPDMGSDIHTAAGLNIFRMIAGKKQWYLIPSNQAPYLYGFQNPQGFSAVTKTQIGHSGNQPSPWLKKIERYTVELSPGDVLVNTAWFWHGVHNLVDKDENELTIGVATRYRMGLHRAFINNWAQTIMTAYGLLMDPRLSKNKDAFQDAILEGRETTNDGLN